MAKRGPKVKKFTNKRGPKLGTFNYPNPEDKWIEEVALALIKEQNLPIKTAVQWAVQLYITARINLLKTFGEIEIEPPPGQYVSKKEPPALSTKDRIGEIESRTITTARFRKKGGRVENQRHFSLVEKLPEIAKLLKKSQEMGLPALWLDPEDLTVGRIAKRIYRRKNIHKIE